MHPIARSPVALGPIVEATLADLSPRIDELGATTAVGPLPSVLGEPQMLTVIFANLVSNALKYGPRDGGEVRIGAEREPDGWRLTVGSDGKPIPAAEADRIFEPFQRGPGERRAQGSGLGLAICTRLVDRLGGRIGVAPHAAGNDFYFVVPAVS
jgi:signal transduction histidine kinase